MKPAPLIYAAATLLCAALPSQAAIIHENFEDSSLGALPTGWTASTSNLTAHVVTGSSQGGESPNQQLLHLQRTSATGGYSYAQTSYANQTEGKLELSFKLQINDRSNSDYAMMLGDASNNASLIYLRFHSNGALSVYHGTAGGQLYTGKIIAEDAWYQFNFEIDLDEREFKFAFDRLDVADHYESSFLDFRGTGATMNQFLIRSINQGVSSTGMAIDWYIDDLNFRPIPEPSTIALLAAGALFLHRRRRQ